MCFYHGCAGQRPCSFSGHTSQFPQPGFRFCLLYAALSVMLFCFGTQVVLGIGVLAAGVYAVKSLVFPYVQGTYRGYALLKVVCCSLSCHKVRACASEEAAICALMRSALGGDLHIFYLLSHRQGPNGQSLTGIDVLNNCVTCCMWEGCREGH